MNTEPTIQMISIELIIPNRFQPRLTFDEQGLNDLSSSIKEHGIIQPLVLRRLGEKYEIIAGERRYKAATMAGLTEVPAIIANLNDNESAEVALVENVQRRDLSSIEEAKSYKKILDKGYLTQEELAKKMGISQSTVANKLRLLNLIEDVQEALMNEKISERHARSLLQLTDSEMQKMMLFRIINERLTVRQLDEEIKKLVNKNDKKEEPVMNRETPSPSFNPLFSSSSTLETLDLDLPSLPNEVPSLTPIINDAKIETLDFDNDLKEDIKPTNDKLLNFFDKSTAFPSLEDEVVNMNMDFNPIPNFNPFSDNNDEDIALNKDKKDDLKMPEIVATSIIQPEKPKEEKIERIQLDNIESVSEAYLELENEVKKAGYKISSETFDFEDLYQIIIKIDKTGN